MFPTNLSKLNESRQHRAIHFSLTTAVKTIPQPLVAPLYPAVLTLAGLAVAECYGCMTTGLIEQMIETSNAPSDALLGKVITAGQALNAHYPGVVPAHWLTAIQPWREQVDKLGSSECLFWDGNRAMGAIAQTLVAAIADGSLDATWLGSIHERLLASSSSLSPAAQHCLPSNPPSNPPSDTVAATAHYRPGRKCQGAYYTPPEVVDYVVRQTLQPALEKQSRDGQPRLSKDLRILDPACGGGAFLVAAYRFLLHQWAEVTGRSPSLDERRAILQASIYGVDIDPQAVAVTRFALHLEWLRGHGTGAYLEAHGADRDGTADALAANVQRGNALIAAGTEGLVWDDAFPTVMEDGGFDVVIGNPPYLDSERMTDWLPHWRRYCVEHYESAQGNWDLFCVFIEKALMLCKPGGYHSFIVPNKLVSAPYAAAVRSRLTTEGILLSIRDYSQSQVFAAAVYPLVYVVQRRSPSPPPPVSLTSHDQPALVRYDRMGRDLEHCRSMTWLPRRCFEFPQTGWLLGDRHSQTDLVLRLRQQFPCLETLAQVHGAASVSEAYRLQTFIQEHQEHQEHSRHYSPVTVPAQAPAYFQVLNSGTIDPYQSLWVSKPLRYLGEYYRQPVIASDDLSSHFPRRFQQAIAPKIIVAGMTKQLECVADTEGTMLAGKSTSIVMPHRLPLLYVLGILNSQPMHHIVMEWLGSNSLRGGYLRIGPPQLRLLPIPLPRERLGDRLVHAVEERIALGRSLNTDLCSEHATLIHQHIRDIEQKIDHIVCDLYQLSTEETEQFFNLP